MLFLSPFKLKKIRQITIVVLALIILACGHLYFTIHSPIMLEKSQSINFTKGSTISRLATLLKQKKLLSNKVYFLLWVKFKRMESSLKAGEYLFSSGESLADLLNSMQAGRVIYHKITLIEGRTFKKALKKIQLNKNLKMELKGFSAKQIMTAIGHEGEHPEGRFYPNTYAISQGTSDKKLLQRAYDALQKILQQQWIKRDDNLPFKTPYEALILASIVEKESAVAEERPLIAGLFINRLRKNMRLQTDPTVIYGIKNYDGNIRYKDLRKDTPYNTYTRYGLPPTPIALVGQDAIHAVLHPKKSDYIFFVALGDGSGRHHFSVTLAEHEKAVKRYLKKIKSRNKK